MFLPTIRSRLKFVTNPFSTFPAVALAISACVPIPIADTQYVPYGAGISVEKSGSETCVVNSGHSTGLSETDGTKIGSALSTVNEGTNESYATLSISVFQPRQNGKVATVSWAPSRIKLADSGRVFQGKLKASRHITTRDGSDLATATFVFPAPSGIGKKVTVEYGEGAIKLSGRALPASSVQFRQEKSLQVYVFPCLPA